jgi:hypothetical protein
VRCWHVLDHVLHELEFAKVEAHVDQRKRAGADAGAPVLAVRQLGLPCGQVDRLVVAVDQLAGLVDHAQTLADHGEHECRAFHARNQARVHAHLLCTSPTSRAAVHA